MAKIVSDPTNVQKVELIRLSDFIKYDPEELGLMILKEFKEKKRG